MFEKKSNITNVFYICMTKLPRTFFRSPFSYSSFENGEGRTIWFLYYSLGNIFHNLAPKFGTLSISYCVVHMFFRAK